MACGCGKSSKQSALKAAQEQKKIEEARKAAQSQAQPAPTPEPVTASK